MSGSYTAPRKCVCGEAHLDRATYWLHRAKTSPTPTDVYDRLREEWEALGLLSFTGDGSGGWRADLNQDDVKTIRALLRDAAATIEAYS